MADNPLVATAPQTSWTSTANMKPLTSFNNATTDFEGAGLFSDAASILSDGTTAKGWTSGAAEMDLVGGGMDLIGAAMDPFGSLLGAGIGWLIEHIGFLKQPLDYLAGDPEEVTAKQQTWENIAKALKDAAGKYQQSASTMASSNTGSAVSGANKTAANFATMLTGAAGHATDAADAMKVAATLVGTTRGVIRDSLSQFAGDAVVKWIAATAAAFFTFGATEAAFVVDEVAEGTSLALQNGSKVSKVVQALEKLKGAAKDSKSALEKAGDSIAKDSGKDIKDIHERTTTSSASGDATHGKEPSLQQKVDQHKQALDDHNQNVAQHNADAANFRQESAAHNQKAIENEQNVAANNHARDMNQQAINRARAQGRPHQDLMAQHRQLEAEHNSLRTEDTRLSHEQQALEQRHQELNRNAADINANAQHLNAAQATLKPEMGEGWLDQHSLKNEQVLDNGFGDKLRELSGKYGDDAAGLHNPESYRDGVPAPSAADAVGVAKETGVQALSDQPTRQDNIATEYQHRLEELAKSGERQPAWPSAEHPG